MPDLACSDGQLFCGVGTTHRSAHCSFLFQNRREQACSPPLKAWDTRFGRDDRLPLFHRPAILCVYPAECDSSIQLSPPCFQEALALTPSPSPSFLNMEKCHGTERERAQAKPCARLIRGCCDWNYSEAVLRVPYAKPAGQRQHLTVIQLGTVGLAKVGDVLISWAGVGKR